MSNTKKKKRGQKKNLSRQYRNGPPRKKKTSSAAAAVHKNETALDVSFPIPPESGAALPPATDNAAVIKQNGADYAKKAEKTQSIKSKILSFLSGNVRSRLVMSACVVVGVIILAVVVGTVIISCICAPVYAEVGGEVDLSAFTDGFAGKVCRIDDGNDLSTDRIDSRELSLVFFGFVRRSVTLEVRDTTPPQLAVKNIIAAPGIELSPEDFVTSSDDLTITAFSFGDDKDLRLSVTDENRSDDGEKEIVITATDEGGNETSKTARLTCDDASLLIEAEFGTPSDDIREKILSAHPEIGSYDLGRIDDSACGDQTVVIPLGDTDLYFMISIRDTTPPSGTAHSFDLLKGDVIPEDELVTDISDFSQTKVTLEGEIDFTKTGKTSVQIVLSDEYGNETRLTSEIVIHDVPEKIEAELGLTNEELAKLLLSGDDSLSFPEGFDVSQLKMGENTVLLRGANNDVGVTVVFADTVPPELTLHDLTADTFSEVKPEDFVERCIDVSEVTFSFEKPVSTEKGGEFTVAVIAEDSAGNKTRSEAVLTIVPDITPPAISGVHDMRVLAGTAVSFSEGISANDNRDGDVEVTIDSSSVDLYSPGTYTVIYTATDSAGNKSEEKAKITVFVDTTPPVIYGVKDLSTNLGESVSYMDGVYAVDDVDGTVSVTVDASLVDLNQPLSYRIYYSAVDSSGNKANESAILTVNHDTQAPVISGVKDLRSVIGENITFLSGVSAYDNIDGSVAVNVDSSAVNRNAVGTYTIVYTAVDRAGNRQSVNATVTIVPITIDVVNEKADAILAQIITDGMTTREKAWAIYQWFCYNFRYSATTAYLMGNYVEAAYSGFRTFSGNCYFYYACSSVMFNRLGITNIEIHRDSTVNPHYWNLVQIDGNWYHFDACPHYTYAPLVSFLLTDAQVEYYSNTQAADYYKFDHTLYPATP